MQVGDGTPVLKRTVVVSSPGIHLAHRDGQLVLLKEGAELGKVPMEDMGVLILDGPGLSLTSAVLEGLATAGAVLISCGADHMPAAILHPLAGNSTHNERLRHQVETSQPLRKLLWARLVRAKLLAQAAAVPSETARRQIEHLASGVKSGDREAAEAQGARIYWEAFFADCDPGQILLPFRRNRDGSPPNALLNYGYTVLRAAVARALCGAGLHPALGVQHHSRYDSFALASDVMEPFRPWVDRRVKQLVLAGSLRIDRESKAHLLQVLTDPVQYGDVSGPLLAATERCCSSLAECYLSASRGAPAPVVVEDLVLPSWPLNLEPDQHDEEEE